MYDSDSSTIPRPFAALAVREADRRGYERGLRDGKAAGAETLAVLKSLSGLNGNFVDTLELLHTAAELVGEHEDEEDESPVSKAATFVESEHPRNKSGEFIPKGDVDEAAREAAKGNSAKADALRAEVRPEDAHILEEHLAHPDPAHPSARTGDVRGQRKIGEQYGEHVAEWVKAVAAAIRHGAEYDHGDVQRGIARAVAGTVPKLRRVLRALDPDTKLSDQPATKEGVQRKIRELISTAVHAARDIREHSKRAEKESRDRELHEHAVRHALALRDAVGHLERMTGWHSAEPSSAAAGDAVHAAREQIARLLGYEEGAAVKAFEDVIAKSRDAAGHEHRGKGPGGGQFTGKGDKEPHEMTAKQWHDLKGTLEINWTGTGGDSQLGMGRATSEEGFARIAAAREAVKRQLYGDHPRSAWVRYPDDSGQPTISQERPKQGDPDFDDAYQIELGHRHLVESAVAAGKDVPAEVLADYPDLVKPAKKEDGKEPPPPFSNTRALNVWTRKHLDPSAKIVRRRYGQITLGAEPGVDLHKFADEFRRMPGVRSVETPGHENYLDINFDQRGEAGHHTT